MVRTYNDIYLDAKRRLKAAFSGSNDEKNAAAATEARLLLAFAAEKTPSEFVRDLRLYAPQGYEEKAEGFLRRRLAGEPAAYITGGWEFFGLPFLVTPQVLIPRMDTEVAAEAALRLLREREAPRVLDLCTGSGCLGIALAVHLPGARLVLADCSAEALRVARRNSVINRVSARCALVEADALSPPPAALSGLDLIVSNPPYIRSDEIEGLDVSVRDYEPRLALDGGEDGLRFYRSICRDWQAALVPGGFLVLECGEGQAAAVAAIGEEAGLCFVKTEKDTLGVERVVEFTAQ